MSDAKKEDKEESKKVEVQSVEEDDEFEEFPLQDWQAKENADEEEELNVWEDNWDDEAHENDFSKQLREELAKHGSKTIV
ncbi:putative 26S proteasome complex subunit dss-1 [Toxocara canis]|uniref:26S proteasome complex subunit dss-1 n=1 Tax=Toxocara canis TaxID=6265 RepID=A0A0B2VFY9_TOXCA|nr:putative 26S proteasome complex subunit dss-1 [Toxocara canis]